MPAIAKQKNSTQPRRMPARTAASRLPPTAKMLRPKRVWLSIQIRRIAEAKKTITGTGTPKMLALAEHLEGLAERPDRLALGDDEGQAGEDLPGRQRDDEGIEPQPRDQARR